MILGVHQVLAASYLRVYPTLKPGLKLRPQRNAQRRWLCHDASGMIIVALPIGLFRAEHSWSRPAKSWQIAALFIRTLTMLGPSASEMSADVASDSSTSEDGAG